MRHALLYGSILLLACQDLVKDKACPNQDLLYTQAADSIPVFDVRENKALYPFLDSLVAINKQDEGNALNGYFVWRDSVDILVQLDPTEWSQPPPRCFIAQSQLRVELLNNGVVYAEFKKIAIASLDSLWQLHQSNNGKSSDFSSSPYEAFAEIQLDSIHNLDSLNGILNQINQGRNSLLKNLNEKRFGLSFCTIPIDSLLNAGVYYPMHFQLNR